MVSNFLLSSEVLLFRQTLGFSHEPFKMPLPSYPLEFDDDNYACPYVGHPILKTRFVSHLTTCIKSIAKHDPKRREEIRR